MLRTFVEIPLFSKRWRELELEESDLARLHIAA